MKVTFVQNKRRCWEKLGYFPRTKNESEVSVTNRFIISKIGIFFLSMMMIGFNCLLFDNVTQSSAKRNNNPTSSVSIEKNYRTLETLSAY